MVDKSDYLLSGGGTSSAAHDGMLQTSPLELFSFTKLIGRGSYGKVYCAVHKQNGCQRAFKVLPLDGDATELISSETRRELLSLRECHSPYVVQYHGAYVHDCQLWIAMEYCIVSTQGAMRQAGAPLRESEVAAVCLQALRGLHYLHTRRQIIHRDVKAANILLTEEGRVKLADFGVAAQLSGTLSKRSTVIGTPMWMSPEMIEAGQYDHTTDLWYVQRGPRARAGREPARADRAQCQPREHAACTERKRSLSVLSPPIAHVCLRRSLGITAIELAELHPPHSEVMPPVRVLFLVPSLPPPTLARPEAFSDAFNAFVAACLVKDPADRPDAAAALAEPFIVGADAGGDEGASVLLSLMRDHQQRAAGGKQEASSEGMEPAAAASALTAAGGGGHAAGDDSDAALAAGGTLPIGSASVTGQDAQATLRADAPQPDAHAPRRMPQRAPHAALVDISDDGAEGGGGTMLPSDATIEIVAGTIDLGQHVPKGNGGVGGPAAGDTLPMGFSMAAHGDGSGGGSPLPISGDGGTLLSPITAGEIARARQLAAIGDGLPAATAAAATADAPTDHMPNGRPPALGASVAGSGYSWMAGYSDDDLGAHADEPSVLSPLERKPPPPRVASTEPPPSAAAQAQAPAALPPPTEAEPSSGPLPPPTSTDHPSAMPDSACVTPAAATPMVGSATTPRTPHSAATTPSRVSASGGSRSASQRWKGIRTTLRRLTPRGNSGGQQQNSSSQ